MSQALLFSDLVLSWEVGDCADEPLFHQSSFTEFRCLGAVIIFFNFATLTNHKCMTDKTVILLPTSKGSGEAHVQ